MKLFRKMKKGFTLVELVVVIAVIAILAAVSVGAYFGVTESAKASKLEQEAKEIYTAVQIVGNSNSSNHQIDADGLHIVDTEVFEDAINDVTGGSYNVYKEGEPVAGEAIVLKQKVVEGAALAGATTYTSFEYYTEETGKNAGSIDVISGEYKATTNNDIEINPVYHTAEEVNKAIKDGKTLITFGSSICFDDNLLINGKTVTLDLNGHTISAQHKEGVKDINGGHHDDLFVVRAIGNAVVTITGNGKMQFIDNSKDFTGAAAILAAYEGSTIIVENGEYVSKPWNGATVLYSKGSGVIEVKDGIFNALGENTTTGRSYAFNTRCVAETCGDSGANYEAHNCSVKHFKVSGGVFYREGNNPKSFTNGCTHNFLEQGYDVVTGEDNGIVTYTVVKAA